MTTRDNAKFCGSESRSPEVHPQDRRGGRKSAHRRIRDQRAEHLCFGFSGTRSAYPICLPATEHPPLRFQRSGAGPDVQNVLHLSTILAAAMLIILSPPLAFGQPGVSPYYKTPDSLAGKTVIIPAGTTFEGRIDRTIGSSVSKQGTSFTISLSSPVLANGTDVLIPAGAQVLGEVVQAIPASQVPHKKKEKPPGELRIQITALRMPDGMTFPMVANLIGEEEVAGPYGGYGGRYGQSKSHLGSGIGYVGTQQGFQTVQPGRTNRGYRGNNSSGVVTKEELLNDPIMGREKDMDSSEKMAIRSLVKKNRDLYIYVGSPLTVRLEAPFKMGVSASSGQESALDATPFSSQSPDNTGINTSPRNPENRSAPVAAGGAFTSLDSAAPARHNPYASGSLSPAPTMPTPNYNYWTPRHLPPDGALPLNYPPSGSAPPPANTTLNPMHYNNAQPNPGNPAQTNSSRPNKPVQDSNF